MFTIFAPQDRWCPFLEIHELGGKLLDFEQFAQRLVPLAHC